MPQRDDMEFSMITQGLGEQNINCDILIYNKYCITSISKLKELKAQGMKIIVDVDDYWNVTPAHPQYDMFIKHNIGGMTEDHIRLADIVFCTTMRLQDKIRQSGLNKNTVVIPNALPFGYDQYTVGDRERGREISQNNKMRFMYLARNNHGDDLQLLEGKFKRIGTEAFIYENAQFIWGGYNSAQKKIYATKEDFEKKTQNYKTQEVPAHKNDQYMANVFRSTKSFVIYPTVDIEYYLNYYDSAEVALAPLKENEWNKYKSPLKIIEAGCKHIPIMCSAVAPYYPDCVEFEQEGVILIKHQEDWLKQIRYCIKNPNYVKDMGEKLFEWTSKEFDLIRWNAVRQQVFESLIYR